MGIYSTKKPQPNSLLAKWYLFDQATLNSDLSDIAQRVLLVLLLYHNCKTGKMLSLRENNRAGLRNRAGNPISERQVRRGIRELREKGWLEVRQRHNASSQYEFNWSLAHPVDKSNDAVHVRSGEDMNSITTGHELNQNRTRTQQNEVSSCPTNRCIRTDDGTDEKRTETQGVSNRLSAEEQEAQDELRMFEEYFNKYDPPYSNKEQAGSNLSLHEKKSSAAPPAPPADVDGAFTCFWEYYPRKDKREKAREAFARIVQAGHVAIDAIVDGAAHYAENMSRQYKDPVQRERFTTMPDKWLNERGWEDKSAQWHSSSNYIRKEGRYSTRCKEAQEQQQQELDSYKQLVDSYEGSAEDIDAMCTAKLNNLF
jgi:hypothetical protein